MVGMYSKVAENIYVIDTGGLGFDRTIACYLVVDDKKALIDTGYARGIDRILTTLKELGVGRLDYIIPTHAHLDHFGATGQLSRIFPEAKILAHGKAAKHIIDPSRVIEGAKSIFGEFIMRKMGETLPVEESRVEVVDDGARLVLGSMELEFIYTPGHAYHQMSVLETRSNVLVTADAVGIMFPDFPYLIPTTPPPGFNPSEAEKTIRKLSELSPTVLLTPHFGAREGGEAYFELNISRMWEWVATVERVAKEGGGLEEAVREIVAKLSRESGQENIPPFALGSVKTSVLGMLHYLGKL